MHDVVGIPRLTRLFQSEGCSPYKYSQLCMRLFADVSSLLERPTCIQMVYASWVEEQRCFRCKALITLVC